MVTISELSSQTGLSTRVIRHYTTIGLITAIEKNSERGKRTYTDSEVEKLKIISMLRELGLNLNEIGCILQCKLIDVIDFKVDNSLPTRNQLINGLKIKKNNFDLIFKYLKIK